MDDEVQLATTRGVALRATLASSEDVGSREHLHARDLVSLQRSSGNRAVLQLVGSAPGSAGAPVEEPGLSPPPGPYTGRRLRNDKMDRYERNKHVFKPHIFMAYGPYADAWAPLAGYLRRVFVRSFGSDSGIRLDTSLRDAMFAVIERFNAAKAKDIRGLPAGRHQDGALKNAIWGEFGKQYDFALRRCRAEIRSSNFRHDHEWMAVRFGLVQAPYAYHAKRKVAG